MRFFLSAVLFILVNTVSYAQDVDWKKMIESWREDFNVPGMSVGIIKDGNIILSEGFGYLEESKSEKADKHTLYAIASNTKAFISAAIGTLVEEGKLSWDDKVQKWLPYFELYDPCVSEMMSVRDLLCHRAGLGTFSGDVIWYRSDYTGEEVVRHAAAIPQAFEFRNGYGYSNVMYITAGEVIRAVSGKSWADYVEEVFLSPLEMGRTKTSATKINDQVRTSNVAVPHKPEGETENPIDWVLWENSGAAGGIISSADDMLKWMKMQLDRGVSEGDTFFMPSTQLTMWTPHSNFTVSNRAHEIYGRNFSGYGLGWSLNDYHGHFVVSHTGGYDGMYSSVYLLPHDRIGVVVLTNSMHSIGPMLTYEVLDKLLGLPQKNWRERGLNQDKANADDRTARIKERIDARVSGTSPSMTRSAIAGLYRDDLYGEIRLLEENNELYIDFLKSPELKARLTHWHFDTYQINWLREQAWFGFGTVQVLKDNQSRPSGLLFDVPNDDIFFEEIKAVRISP